MPRAKKIKKTLEKPKRKKQSRATTNRSSVALSIAKKKPVRRKRKRTIGQSSLTKSLLSMRFVSPPVSATKKAFTAIRHFSVKNPLWVVTSVLILGVFAIYLNSYYTLAVADTYTVSSEAEWEAGEYWQNQFDTNTSKGDLKLIEDNGGVWSTDTPAWPTEQYGNYEWKGEPAYYGADLTTDGTYVYMIVGGRQPELFRYNPDIGTWKTLQPAPTGFLYGGSLAYYEGVIYALNGQDGSDATDATPHLFAYDIATDTWSKKADAPDNFGLGSDIVSGENGLMYVSAGRSLDGFWSYDTSSDTWSDTLPSVPSPYQIYTTTGHALVYSGTSYGADPIQCESGCVFAYRGNNNRQFFRYDISLNQWYDGFADVPTALGNSGRIHYGSSMAWDEINGKLYAMTGSNDDEFMSYDIATESWDATSADVEDLGLPVDEGGSLTYLDGDVYILPGISRYAMMKYDIDDASGSKYKTIITPAAAGNNGEDDLMAFVPNGSDCSDAEGCLFVMRGANTNTFWRYDIGANIWTTLASATNGRQRGASMCYDGNDTIFSLEGDNTRNTQKYSISGDSWTSAGTIGVAGDEVYYGGAVTCLGDDDALLIRGDSDYESFRGNGTSWTQDDNVPVDVYYGGALTHDGTYAYALAGDDRGLFFRFDPAAGAGSRWTEMATLPQAAYLTATLEFDGDDKIFAIPGDRTSNMWVYDISDNAWTRGPDVPFRTRYGHASAHDDTNNILYVWDGWNGQTIHKFNTTTNDYVASASWISDTIDLTYATSFNSFSSTATTPGSSSVAFETRTSDDQASWSSWQTVTGGTNIQSPANRYIQVKVTLNSDGTNAPTLSDFTINFEKDSNNPTNPTATGYADNSKATSISSGNSYFYVNPYFELSGGTDAESGLSGYYVSWTTNATHDPTSSEDYFQTGTTYEINTDVVAGSTYYLRVSAKDQANNTAAVQTIFTYTYNGISPASTTVWTAQADFEAAGTSETNINTAAGSGTTLTLDSVSNGVWTHEAPLESYADEGAAMAFDGVDTIYYLAGNNSSVFHSYNINTKTYDTSLTNYGSTVEYGGSLVYVPNGTKCADSEGCLFAMQGDNTGVFKRYNINADTWTTLTAYTPGGVRYGAAMVWDGDDTLFATRGNNTRDFYSYSISGGGWTQKSDVDQTIRYGGSLTYVPNGDYCSDSGGCIFGSRGNSDTDFYRYDVSANNWNYISNTPMWMQYGTSTVYIDGYVYMNRGYVSTAFWRYDIANDLWEWLDPLPTTKYRTGNNGMVYVPAQNEIYAVRGYSEYSMYRYDVASDEWETPGIPTQQATNGAYYAITAWDSDDELFYYSRGNNGTDWFVYDPSTNDTKTLATVPQRVYYGADAEYINGDIYVMSGQESLGDSVGYFYKYDPDTDSWTRLDDLPDEPGYGADLVWDGSGAIYTARGQNTTTYYKYTIGTDTWSTVGSNVPGSVYTGGCAALGNDSGTDYIYLSRGNTHDDIYRFNVGTETWDAAGTLSLAPGAMRYGDACVNDGQGNILIPRGDVANGTTGGLFVYDISDDSWSQRDYLSYYEYGSLTMTADNVVLGFRGEYTSAMERYVVATSSTGFEANGFWTSEVIDFTSGVFGYGGISLNTTIPSGTSLIVETRTCDDAVCTTPGEWTQATNEKMLSSTTHYTVGSPLSQYAQVKLTFSTDQLYSPTVNDITWSYYADVTAPNNPASASGYTDSGKLTSIVSADWTNDATPYLEWTATDNAGGIGVEGFYVYFGTDNTLDPIDDASDATNLAYVGGTNYYAVAGDGTTGSWDASTQSAAALTSDTYYLIIRTRDNNSNTASSSGTLYTFNLDIDDPTRPSSVTADPGSWTSVNDFDFSWPAANDVGGSGIYQYCYSINEGAQTCISPTSVTGITAPQTRENSFCVYSVDNAGNQSSNCRERLFYYAGDAPSAPQNVIIDPVTSVGSPQEDVNIFSFTWDLPSTCLGSAPGSCDGDDLLRYCYTINELPSSENCGTNIAGSATPSPDGGWTTTSQTSSRSLLSFSAATQQGLNTIYIVAADIINNIDYDNYVSADYYFSSNAPGVPASAAVTDTSDRATQKYSVVMTWDEPQDVGSGVTGYNVYRCESGCANPDAVDDPPANYSKIATVNTLGYLDTSLDTNITYSYFSRAAGTGGVQSGNSSVLEIKPEGKFKFAPLMSGQPNVTAYIRSANVEWLTLDDQDQYGNIVPHPASSYVEYGETAAYGNEAGTPDLVNEHEVTMTNLQPDTEYHYRTRWQDQDGNTGYSSDFTFVTKGAPSAPINGDVTPQSNTVNSFTFSWDPPQDEGVTVAGYYYSINNLPNADNVSYTEDTTIGPIEAATQQGTNTFYILAVDDGGNLNYDNYTAIEFIANTTPPGSPRAVTITDSSDRDAKRYSITITWDPPEGYGLDDEIYYTIERAAAEVTADGYRQVAVDDYGEIATITSTGYLDTGLDNTTEYYYQIVAQDKAQATSDQTDPVSEIPEGRYTQPPAITEAPVPSPDSFSTNVTWRTERGASSFVEFGLTSELGEEQGTADLLESHDVKVEGLKPETTYYYRVKSIDIDENIAYSQVGTFTTLEAPRVLDVEITDVRLFDATITWSTNKETTAVIQYGLSTEYGQTLTDVSGGYALDHSLKLENLNDGSEYHLRLEGIDRSGNPIQSDDYSFTTLTFPEVSDIATENKAEGQTEIYWKTNVPTTSIVEYYADNISPKTQGNTVLATEHAVLLFGLEDATRYTFNVRGADEFGYEAVSDDRQFVTLEDTTAPEIFGVQSESNTIGSGEASKIQIVVSWKTNEATTSQVEFGVGLGGENFTDQTDENAELVLDHLTVISDLAPAKTYFFRVVSRDKAGNITKSGSYTVLTSRKRESFLQLIISNLEQTFSWLGNIGSVF